MTILFKPIRCLLLLLLLFLAGSCADADAEVDNQIGSLSVSTGTVYPNFDPAIRDYYITSLNTLKPVTITLGDFDPAQRIFINGIRVTGTHTTLTLSPGQDIVIKSGYHTNTMLTYTIHYLPPDMPRANLITKNNPADGVILVGLFELTSLAVNHSYIAILNNDGFPVFYRQLAANAAFNFKYFNTVDGNRFSYNDISTGEVVVLNENFDEIKRLRLLPHNGHPAYPAENHDFLYFNDSHYVLPAYVPRSGVDLTALGGGASVALTELVFQEIQNNQVIFEWNSADHPELLSASDPIYQAQYATNPQVDYFHFNSFSIDPTDGNFILSARHTNQVYKINRTTGAIMWRFGGSSDDFNLSGNEVISHPHHATRLPNGHLLLFDNGVTKNPKQTRIAEFDLNEVTFNADLVFEYGDTGRYFDILGSAQKLPGGNYFIGWGGNITSQVNANKSDITEIGANGSIVLDLSFTNFPNSFTYSYRALKYNITF